MTSLTTVAALGVVAIPALAAGLGIAPGVRQRAGGARAVAVVGALLTALVAVVVFGTAGNVAQETRLLLAPFGDIDITTGVLVDGLAGVLVLVVAVVGLCVQLYSVGYLHSDPRYPTYAAQVSLFTAAMMLVVVSGDLLAMLVGWEVMGLCSYLLIGHYRDLPEAAGAAVKAFLVTRVGDIGFLLGVLLLGGAAGSFRISDVVAAVGSIDSGTLTLATLLLLLGVAGKSAQFPLHTWLPDAMAGPTPISALIHAATMVAAGVFLVMRLYPVFVAAPATLTVLAVSAAITMLLGALCALAQDDIKRVLGWSTISQLGYMTGALAAGGYVQGGFHLVTHAAFKALLFLAAGVVLHQVGTVLMSELGGLRRSMPITFAFTTIGLLALVGVLPLSGGFSKDAALASAWAAVRDESLVLPSSPVATALLISMLATVLLTAAYATRLLLRTFFGTEQRAGADPKPVMGWPLLALTVPTLALGAAIGWFPGYLGGPIPPGDSLDGFGPAPIPGSLAPQLIDALIASALIVLGAGATYLVWRAQPDRDPARILGRAATALRRGLYLDEVQDALVVRPFRRLATVVSAVDEIGVDGLVDGAAQATAAASRGLSRAHPSLPNLAVTSLIVTTAALVTILVVLS
ncbi:MAG: NADH-quinone oxidoreductase subunit L [Geodermatophilaceae bacterium]|nr:NADH-quinone oxidoreductase subunit L [Geodermatophilaceae bacterium]